MLGIMARQLARDDVGTADLVAGLLRSPRASADDLLAAVAEHSLRVLLAVAGESLLAAVHGDFTTAGFGVTALGACGEDPAPLAYLLVQLVRQFPDGVIEVESRSRRAVVSRALELARFEGRARRPPQSPGAYRSLHELADYLYACGFEHLVRDPGSWLQLALRRGHDRAVLDVGWDAAAGDVSVLHYRSDDGGPPRVRFERRLALDPSEGVEHDSLFEALTAAVYASARRPAPRPRPRRSSLLQAPIKTR